MKLSIFITTLLVVPVFTKYIKSTSVYFKNKNNNYSKKIEDTLYNKFIYNSKKQILSFFNYSNFNDEHIKISILLF